MYAIKSIDQALKCVCYQVVCCCGLHNFGGRMPLSASTDIVLKMETQSHCRFEKTVKTDSDGKLVCSMSCRKDFRSVQRYIFWKTTFNL